MKHEDLKRKYGHTIPPEQVVGFVDVDERIRQMLERQERIRKEWRSLSKRTSAQIVDFTKCG